MRTSSLAILFAAPVALGLILLGSTASAQRASEQLTLEDVQTIIARAATRAKLISPNAVISVVDREGFVLGVWSVPGNANESDDRIGGAVREAGTASYLSSDQNAFTSRTAQYIIQQNFPPGIRNRPTGPLVGVEFSNQPFSDVNRFKRLDDIPDRIIDGKPVTAGNPNVDPNLLAADPKVRGTGIANTRLSGRAGSCPLYKNGVLVGGIGSFSADDDNLAQVLAVELSNTIPGRNKDENIALSGQKGYTCSSDFFANNVTIDGIRVPYVLGKGRRKMRPLAEVGVAVKGFSLHASPPQFPYPQENLGGQSVEVRFKIRADDDVFAGDPSPGFIRGQPRLTEDEVRGIISRASDRARTTRAGIRLPVGVAMEAWLTVVGNPNLDGRPAPILAITRTPGATFFSYDVALQKARTAVFFSSDTMALSSRTVGFLAQNYYPPGLEGRAPGPFGPEIPSTTKLGAKTALQFDPKTVVDTATLGLQVQYSVNFKPGPPPNPNLPNGITVFPGGFPLYRNGVLIGAVGISGDGVDQDDIVGASASGTEFDPPAKVRADEFTYDGARLPYAKFPRNPER